MPCMQFGGGIISLSGPVAISFLAPVAFALKHPLPMISMPVSLSLAGRIPLLPKDILHSQLQRAVIPCSDFLHICTCTGV